MASRRLINVGVGPERHGEEREVGGVGAEPEIARPVVGQGDGEVHAALVYVEERFAVFVHDIDARLLGQDWPYHAVFFDLDLDLEWLGAILEVDHDVGAAGEELQGDVVSEVRPERRI